MNVANEAPSVLDGVNRLTQLAGRNRLELLMFSLVGKQRYGINVFKVREVIRCPSLTKVPDSKPGVCGLATIRGHTISVLDLSAMIGCEPLADSADRFVVVAEYNRHTVGFLVGDVHSIVNKNWEEIKPPPEALSASGYLTAVTTIGDELVEILDVEQVLGDLIGAADERRFAEVELDDFTANDIEVFIADDSSVARKQLTRTMDEMGVRYRLATNGREALDLLKMMAEESEVPLPQRLPIVISDIEMPEMDGYALTCEIRNDDRLSGLYVCLHTSLSGSFNKAMAERVGADTLIPKFDPAELASLVRGRLESLDDSIAA